ncbi:MAG: hypothetical protein HY040_22630 [Planctomycetes bacterium]|nr:hypothetical protein [Planctomycetota bacterium]
MKNEPGANMKGVPQAVLIDLKKNRRLWEDFRDIMVAQQRRNEPRESFEEVKAILKKQRKNNGKG